MIKTSSATHAQTLANHYAEKGLCVIAKPNSVLGELVRLCNITNIPLGLTSSPENFDPSTDQSVKILSEVSTGTHHMQSDHDVYIDKVAAQISKAVLSHINFAKNVVKPAVLEVGAAIDKTMQSFSPETPESTVHIHECDIPSPLRDMMLLEELKVYDKTSVNKPGSTYAHGEKTYEEILALMLTGDQDTDEAIIDWCSHLNPETVVQRWNACFRGSFSHLSPTDHVFNELDLGLMIYLVGRRLMEDQSHNTGKMLASQYKEMMAQARDYGGSLVMQSLNRAKAFDRTNVVVIQTRPHERSCYVYGPNYRAWLQNGGKPETLLGLVVSGELLSQSADLSSQKERLQEIWSSYVSFKATNNALARFSAFKSCAALAVRESFTNATSVEKEAWNDIPGFSDKSAKLLEAEVNKLSSAEISDPYGVAVRLVCRARFFYTDAESILSGIEAVMKEHPNISPREAASISVLFYVADYIADQMLLAV